MNICIYTVHLFLYECITCKEKSCLSNYCTFLISYVTTKIQNNFFFLDIPSLLLVRPKIFINITSDVFHCHAPGGKISLNAAPIPCNYQLWCPHMQHSCYPTETSDLVVYDHILSTSMLKKTLLLDLGMRVWWKELHCYPFMCSKPVPNNVGSVEADIIPDNNIIRQMWSN